MNDDYYISLIDESNIYDSKLHPILMVKETYLFSKITTMTRLLAELNNKDKDYYLSIE